MKAGELGSFLRSRRESVTPAEVGLPPGSGRRTPGLRRAELATLAGVSIDYLIRIEQGRDTNPSPRVLAALADALRLGEEDRGYLRALSVVSQGPELCPTARPAARSIRPAVAAILAQLEPAPAYVANHLFDLLSWTTSFERLVRPIGLLDGPSAAPNLLSYLFTDPRARTAFPHWDEVADTAVAALRGEVCASSDDAHRLAEQLGAEAGSAFSARWQRSGAAGNRSGALSVAHPEVGMVRMHYETMELADPERQRLVIYLPADPAASVALDRLAGRHPGALRPVAAR